MRAWFAALFGARAIWSALDAGAAPLGSLVLAAGLVRALGISNYGVAVVAAGDSEYPLIPDATAPFVYARIMGTKPKEPLGYSVAELDAWAARARSWAGGGHPRDFPPVSAEKPSSGGRDVFLYVISGHKVANPAAAQALIERVK